MSLNGKQTVASHWRELFFTFAEESAGFSDRRAAFFEAESVLDWSEQRRCVSSTVLRFWLEEVFVWTRSSTLLCFDLEIPRWASVCLLFSNFVCSVLRKAVVSKVTWSFLHCTVSGVPARLVKSVWRTEGDSITSLSIRPAEVGIKRFLNTYLFSLILLNVQPTQRGGPQVAEFI